MGVGSSLATRVFECQSYPERVRMLETALSGDGAISTLLSLGSSSSGGGSGGASPFLPKLDELADGDSSHVTLLERLATCYMFESSHPSWARIRPAVLAAVRRIRRPNTRNRTGDALIHVMLQCAASVPAAAAAADPELLEFTYQVTAALLELGSRRRSRPKPLAVAARLGWSRTPSPAVSQAPSDVEGDDSEEWSGSGSSSGPDSPPPDPPPPSSAPRSHSRSGLSQSRHGSRSCMHVQMYPPTMHDHTSSHFLSVPNSGASSAVSTPRGGRRGSVVGAFEASSSRSERERDRARRKRLRRMVDINAIGGRWGLAPLHWVCHIEHEATAFHMLTLLLSRGNRGGGGGGGVGQLDLSVRDSEGNTFLHQLVLLVDKHALGGCASRLRQVFAIVLGRGECIARGHWAHDQGGDWFALDARGRTFLQLEQEQYRARMDEERTRVVEEQMRRAARRKRGADTGLSPLHRPDHQPAAAAAIPVPSSASALPSLHLPSPLLSASSPPTFLLPPLPGTPPLPHARTIVGGGGEEEEAASVPPALPPSVPPSPLGPAARRFNPSGPTESEPESESDAPLSQELSFSAVDDADDGASDAAAAAARTRSLAKLSILHECCAEFEAEWRGEIRPMIQSDIHAHLPNERVVAIALAFIDGMS